MYYNIMLSSSFMVSYISILKAENYFSIINSHWFISTITEFYSITIIAIETNTVTLIKG